MTDHEALLNDLRPGKMIRLTGGGTILKQQDGSLLYTHDDHEREVSKADALTILTDHEVVLFRYWGEGHLGVVSLSGRRPRPEYLHELSAHRTAWGGSV